MENENELEIIETTQILLVRHGAYDEKTGQLNIIGKDQIACLAKKIACILDGDEATILSSPAIRANETAQIIAKFLGTSFTTHDELISGSGYKFDLAALYDLVKSIMGKTKTIILVTHLEYAEEFLRYFALKDFNATLDIIPIEKGNMINFRWSKKRITYSKVHCYHV